jgi:hypothetical protein
LKNSWPNVRERELQGSEKNQPIGAKGEKASPRHEKRESTHHQQGNFVYPFVGSVTPCSWYYHCYYSPTDYSSMC